MFIKLTTKISRNMLFWKKSAQESEISLGKNARLFAEEKFDQRKINRIVLSIIGEDEWQFFIIFAVFCFTFHYTWLLLFVCTFRHMRKIKKKKNCFTSLRRGWWLCLPHCGMVWEPIIIIIQMRINRSGKYPSGRNSFEQSKKNRAEIYVQLFRKVAREKIINTRKITG